MIRKKNIQTIIFVASHYGIKNYLSMQCREHYKIQIRFLNIKSIA